MFHFIQLCIFRQEQIDQKDDSSSTPSQTGGSRSSHNTRAGSGSHSPKSSSGYSSGGRTESLSSTRTAISCVTTGTTTIPTATGSKQLPNGHLKASTKPTKAPNAAHTNITSRSRSSVSPINTTKDTPHDRTSGVGGGRNIQSPPSESRSKQNPSGHVTSPSGSKCDRGSSHNVLSGKTIDSPVKATNSNTKATDSAHRSTGITAKPDHLLSKKLSESPPHPGRSSTPGRIGATTLAGGASRSISMDCSSTSAVRRRKEGIIGPPCGTSIDTLSVPGDGNTDISRYTVCNIFFTIYVLTITIMNVLLLVRKQVIIYVSFFCVHYLFHFIYTIHVIQSSELILNMFQSSCFTHHVLLIIFYFSFVYSGYNL